jgi:hypothetical protein
MDNRGQQQQPSAGSWSSRRRHLYSIKTDWVDAEQERQYDLTPVSGLTKSPRPKSPSGYSSVDPWAADDGDDDEDESDEELPRLAPSNPPRPAAPPQKQPPLQARKQEGSPSADGSVEPA